MNVYQVIRKKLKKLQEHYKFNNGDVYLVITPLNVWIWIGSKSFADDKAVVAWGAKVVEEGNKELLIKTISEGDEPEEFKSILNFEVVEGDTPGFLKHFEKKVDIDYKLLRIIQRDDGEIETKEVPIKMKSFKSGDTFVLDAWDDIYVWIGKDSQVREKYEAGKIARKLDVERKRKPFVYTVEEGQEPEGFKEFVIEAARIDKELEKKK